MRLPYKAGTVRVTSPYGNRVLDGVSEMHKGIDLVGSDKTLVAPCGGVVGWAGLYDDMASGGRTWEWGGYVRIDTDDGYSVYLCHMATISVSRGKRISAGDVIGTEGSTGRSTGSHCHFEVRRSGRATDPSVYLGIANRVGSYPVAANVQESTDYARLVCEKCGLEAQTRAYLDRYKYSTDLWRKLWEAMS